MSRYPRANLPLFTGLILATAINCYVAADGSTVGKIYSPYVDQLATEIELQLQDESDSDLFAGEKYRLGVGRPLTPALFAEVYLLGVRMEHGDFKTAGYEAELRWQLSEQGEYTADYGVLFELERETEKDIWEATAKLLISKEFGRISATANAGLTYEYGDDLASEWETSLALQARYRYRPQFEPAIEYFKGQDTNAIGPVVMGVIRTGIGKKVSWELGVIWGLDSKSVERTIKARLEYEF